jgi:hypothetical protein
VTASDSGKSAATARIARHRQAGEVMQARAVLLVACSLWLLGGGALDLFAHTRGEPGALAEVLGLRAGTSVLHLAVLVILYKHASLPRWLVASAITLVFPLTALSMMVIVVLRGGVASRSPCSVSRCSCCRGVVTSCGRCGRACSRAGTSGATA